VFVVLGILLLKLPHSIGGKAVWLLVVSAWLTWLMALSEVANAWWGANQMLPVAAGQAGATGAAPWQELVVKLCHVQRIQENVQSHNPHQEYSFA
jgi:hydroxylaminobenzene mutase